MKWHLPRVNVSRVTRHNFVTISAILWESFFGNLPRLTDFRRPGLLFLKSLPVTRHCDRDPSNGEVKREKKKTINLVSSSLGIVPVFMKKNKSNKTNNNTKIEIVTDL